MAYDTVPFAIHENLGAQVLHTEIVAAGVESCAHDRRQVLHLGVGVNEDEPDDQQRPVDTVSVSDGRGVDDALDQTSQLRRVLNLIQLRHDHLGDALQSAWVRVQFDLEYLTLQSNSSRALELQFPPKKSERRSRLIY